MIMSVSDLMAHMHAIFRKENAEYKRAKEQDNAKLKRPLIIKKGFIYVQPRKPNGNKPTDQGN